MNTDTETTQGAFPLRIKARPLLVPATMGYGPATIFIYVATEQSREEAAISVWHEVVHVLLFAGGAHEHDEDEVERAAQKLAKAYPEVLEWVGLSAQFPICVNPCPSVVEKSEPCSPS